MTPYRSARVEGRAIDPARPRAGLAGAAVASLAVFFSLVHMATHHGASAFDAVLLYTGSASMALLLAYSSFDAPAGRGVLFVSAGAFALSLVPQTVVRALMSSVVWPARYLAIAGIACALLLRLRRTRPGSHGVMLRLAAALAAWWGLQWLVAPLWRDGSQSVRSELVSRAIYLLLAAGMLDMRRFVGTAPERDPVRTTLDTAREVATTRACLALVSLAAALSALPYAWHSEWTVIATAEAIALATTLSFHVPWLLRAKAPIGALVAIPAAAAAFLLGCRAFDVRSLAASAAAASAIAAIAADLAVAAVAARSPAGKSAGSIALSAVALHALVAAVVVLRA